jgi:hypothetical protein
MGTATKIALALTLLFGLGSSALAVTSSQHVKKVRHTHAQKVQQQAPATIQSQNPGCFNDEGGGRIRPCGTGGGGAGGGGGY